jgi:putative endonuclease
MHDYRPKQPCVYLLASDPNGVLYTGVTSDLAQRVSLHKQKLIDGFTKRYGVTRLVYYEMHETMDAAIRRESQIKKWKRTWKVRLIKQMNPERRELFDEATGEIRFGPADVERERG